MKHGEENDEKIYFLDGVSNSAYRNDKEIMSYNDNVFERFAKNFDNNNSFASSERNVVHREEFDVEFDTNRYSERGRINEIDSRELNCPPPRREGVAVNEVLSFPHQNFKNNVRPTDFFHKEDNESRGAPEVIVISDDDDDEPSVASSEDLETFTSYTQVKKTSYDSDTATASFASEETSDLQLARKIETERPISPDSTVSETPLSIHKQSSQGKADDDEDQSINRGCLPKTDVGNSPIARAFYAKSAYVKVDVSKKVGVSSPLQATLIPTRKVSSLQPQFFNNCQMDLLEGLADDPMFFDAYINMVSSFTTDTIVPPLQVVRYMLSNLINISSEKASIKALHILRRLLESRALNYRNLSLCWDDFCDVFDKILSEFKLCYEGHSYMMCVPSEEACALPYNSMISQGIRSLSFLLNFFEQDFVRYLKNVRNAILWKVVSPNVYGNARLRDVGDWFVKCFNIIEEAENAASKSKKKLFTSLNITKSLHRLVNLMFLSSRDENEFAKAISEMSLNCFFEVRALKRRKEFLLTIESALVQRVTVELLLCTLCEDTDKSEEFQDRRISLEKIVFGYFYKIPPHKTEQRQNYWEEEETEEFIFLLYLLVKSYLALAHVDAKTSSSYFSILPAKEAFNTTGRRPLPLSDCDVLLTINDELQMLKDRVYRYRGFENLGNGTRMYLNLLSTLLNYALESSF